MDDKFIIFLSHRYLEQMFQRKFGQLKNLLTLKVHHQHQDDLVDTNIIITIIMEINIIIIVIIVDDIVLQVLNQFEIDSINH